MAAWWTIGKYNMRLNLGKYYRSRKISFPITAIVFIVYGFLFKFFIDANPDNIIIDFMSNKALFATLLDLLMLYIFIYLIMIHVFTGMKRQNKSSLELLLSSPVSSSDIVLGETIASLPIYLLALPVILIPLLILGYFQANIGILGILKIVFSQFLLAMLAVGFGAIVLTLLQTSIQRTKTSKYFRLLVTMISAGLYLSIYFINSWLSTAEGITQNMLFSLLPTSLTGNIAFSEISGYIPEPTIPVSFMLLLAWIGVIYGFGIRMAGKAYSLEKELSSATVSITKEGFLYKIVRYITPRAYTEKVVTHFKLYFRDSNNSATSIYLIIIGYFIPVIFAWTSKGEANETLQYMYLVSTLMIPMFVSISINSMFYLSRDALWIWKKAPGGSESFIYSKWIQSFILSLIFIPVPVISAMLFGTEVISPFRVVATVFILLFANTYSVSFGMFLNILSPTKSIQGAKTGLNAMIATLAVFFVLLLIIIPILQWGNYYILTVVLAVVITLLDYLLISLSKRRIDKAMDV